MIYVFTHIKCQPTFLHHCINSTTNEMLGMNNVFGKRHRAICLSANQIALFRAPICYPGCIQLFSKALFNSVADQCVFLGYLFSCKLHFPSRTQTWCCLHTCYCFTSLSPTLQDESGFIRKGIKAKKALNFKSLKISLYPQSWTK